MGADLDAVLDACAAIEAKAAALFPDPLDGILNGLRRAETRFDGFEWVESKHPRGADGKFTSGSGAGSAGHGAKAYAATLKPGQKGSAAALIKYMVEAGTYGKDDITTAALESYDVKPASVPWYLNDIKKKTGKAAPDKSKPPPKAAALEPEAPKAAALEPEAPEAAALEPEAPKAEAPAAAVDLKEKLANANQFMSPVIAELEGVFSHWEDITQANKPLVEGKLKEILKALGEPNDLAQLQALKKIGPIDGVGMSVAAVNKALTKVKESFGIDGAPAPYAPETKAQQKVYAALSKVPHYQQDHVNYFRDAQDKKVRAVLKTDTEQVPGDYYALVSSAYGSKPDDGNTHAVGAAMAKYGEVQHKAYDADEKAALGSYKGSGYMAINQMMLNGIPAKPNEYEKDTVAKIERVRSAMKKSFVPADTPVYRGLKASLEQLTGFSDPADAVGRCFVHANFASVSRDPSVSKRFGKAALLKFTVPAGANGVVLGSQAGGEKEIALPDHAVFRVVKVEPGGMGAENLIHVQYLGTKEDV